MQSAGCQNPLAKWLALSWLVSCPVFFRLALSCPLSSCPVLCPVWLHLYFVSCTVLSCSVSSRLVLSCISSSLSVMCLALSSLFLLAVSSCVLYCILSCLIFCPVLLCLVFSCPVLPFHALPCLLFSGYVFLSCSIFSCLVPSCLALRLAQVLLVLSTKFVFVCPSFSLSWTVHTLGWLRSTDLVGWLVG